MKQAGNEHPLVKTYKEVANLHGPAGDEREIAEWLVRRFKRHGWRTWVDNANTRTGSTTGNVYAYKQVDEEAPVLVFSAHMDTVSRPGERITAEYSNGRFKSQNGSELGIDNRAGVACLLELADHLPKKLDKNVLFFFPTTEEKGVMGSAHFGFPPDRIKYVFNVDDSDQPGTFTIRSLGYVNFSVSIHGVASHAAQHYEQGTDAIRAAAALIKSFPIGPNAKLGTAINIGTIHGGEAVNMVADHVRMEGEARAFTDKSLKELLGALRNVCSSVAKKTGAKIDFTVDKESMIPPFVITENSQVSEVSRKAAKAAGLTARFKDSLSTSDASWLAQQCKQTIIVARGGRNPHSKRETLTLEELKQTLALLENLVKLA